MLNIVNLYPPMQPGQQSVSPPPEKRGLGTMIEGLVKPIAKILRLNCLEKSGDLKPESPCAKRRDALNKLLTGKPKNP